MIKFLIIQAVVFSLISCSTDYSAKLPETNINIINLQSTQKTSIIQDTVYIKKWLTKVITDYVNSDDLNIAYENMRTALTEDYYNYKHDAIILEYSEMTEKEFHQKWKAKYDTRYVGNGGFFTSVQDNGTVEIPICTHLKSLGDSAQVFQTVIRDLRWKTDYVMDITVVIKNNTLLIDDVKEYK
ncbi:MAG: hypothetical protein J7604_23775 [Sporocytophaga sp.]|uniref:hypothetical protein n=1 Tax=Sporocytophaga sp. TaxID=2231183 RepID=UPI001B2E9454|nr:hypothetical protein [Sporocytophaga sp.]MBO9703255.1 hypothetical protein [Sporocytophaga sp.]